MSGKITFQIEKYPSRCVVLNDDIQGPITQNDIDEKGEIKRCSKKKERVFEPSDGFYAKIVYKQISKEVVGKTITQLKAQFYTLPSTPSSKRRFSLFEDPQASLQEDLNLAESFAEKIITENKINNVHLALGNLQSAKNYATEHHLKFDDTRYEKILNLALKNGFNLYLQLVKEEIDAGNTASGIFYAAQNLVLKDFGKKVSPEQQNELLKSGFDQCQQWTQDLIDAGEMEKALEIFKNIVKLSPKDLGEEASQKMINELLKTSFNQCLQLAQKLADSGNMKMAFEAFSLSGDLLPKELKEDPNILASIAKGNLWILKDLSPSLQESTWKILINDLKLQKTPFSTKSYAEFLKDLKTKHGIEFPERFLSLSTLIEVINSRESKTDTRPIALLLYTKIDKTGALAASYYPVIDTFVGSGKFHVLYYEVGNEKELKAVFNSVSEKVTKTIPTVVVAGHGSFTGIALGGADWGTDPTSLPASYVANEEDFLDYSDMTDYDSYGGKYFSFGDVLTKVVTKQIFLLACATGEGGMGLNLASFVGVNAAKGVKVIAAEGPTSLKKLTVGEDTSLTVEWNSAKTFIYEGKMDPKTGKIAEERK